MTKRKRNNLLKKAGVGALLMLTLIAPIKSSAAKPKPDPFKNYPTKIEVMEDSKIDFNITLHGNDGSKTRLDKSFNYGIKVLNSRTSVAVRDITESIQGLELDWDADNNIAVAKQEGKELLYPINKRVMSKEGKVTPLDVAATVDHKVSRTYLPLRSLMESLDYEVDYNNTNKTIDIYEKGATKPANPAPEEKPQVQPTKPEDERGPKLGHTIEISDLGNPDTVVQIQKFDVPDYSKMPVITNDGTGYFPVNRRVDAGHYMTERMDLNKEHTIYDGTDYFRDLEFDNILIQDYNKKRDNQIVSLGGVDITARDVGRDYRFVAVEDINGNLYTANASISSYNKNKPLLGNTIQTIYFLEHVDRAVIKIDLKKPVKIPTEVDKDGSNSRMYYKLRGR